MSDYLKQEEEFKDLMFDGKPVKLKSPGMKALPDFLKVTRDMSKAGKDATPEDIMSCLTDESIQAMTNLINMTIKKSFPDEKDEDKIDEWAMRNNMILMGKVIEMCSPEQSHEQKKKIAQIQRLQHDKSNKKQ